VAPTAPRVTAVRVVVAPVTTVTNPLVGELVELVVIAEFGTVRTPAADLSRMLALARAPLARVGVGCETRMTTA